MPRASNSKWFVVISHSKKQVALCESRAQVKKAQQALGLSTVQAFESYLKAKQCAASCFCSLHNLSAIDTITQVALAEQASIDVQPLALTDNSALDPTQLHIHLYCWVDNEREHWRSTCYNEELFVTQDHRKATRHSLPHASLWALHSLLVFARETIQANDELRDKWSRCFIHLGHKYAFDCVTRHIPHWYNHGWRTDKGKRPAHLTWLKKLHDELTRFDWVFVRQAEPATGVSVLQASTQEEEHHRPATNEE